MSNVKYEVQMLNEENGIQTDMYGEGENCRLYITRISEDGEYGKRIIMPIEYIFDYVTTKAELENTITEKDRTLKERNEKIKKLEAEIKDLQEFRNDDFRELVARDQKIEDLEKRLKEKDEELENFRSFHEAFLEGKHKVIKSLENQIKEKDEVIEDLEDDVDELEKENSGLKDAVIVRDTKIKDLESRVKSLTSDLGRIAAENVDLEDKLLDQNNELSARASKLVELDSKINELQNRLELNDIMIARKARAMNEIVSGKDVEIARLKRQLNIIYGSRSTYSYASIAQNVAIGLKDIEIDSLKAENERLKSGVDKAIVDLNNLNTK